MSLAVNAVGFYALLVGLGGQSRTSGRVPCLMRFNPQLTAPQVFLVRTRDLVLTAS